MFYLFYNSSCSVYSYYTGAVYQILIVIVIVRFSLSFSITMSMTII